MLALTRKAGESIVIGTNIRVQIVAIHGKQVKIAIDAPRDISIRRSELAELPNPHSFVSKTRNNQRY